MDIRFLVDEHLRGQLWHAIGSHNQRGAYPVDVVCVGDSADLPQGSTDPEVLLWTEREGRILVSADRKLCSPILPTISVQAATRPAYFSSVHPLLCLRSSISWRR
ncbi:MAG: hypothetical protein HY040_26730 [Planctomycetes bacterium]|nr:hypothetical protein [Planctomycetota bacterium]